MNLADLLKPVRQGDPKRRWPAFWVALALGVIACEGPAHSECVSPSVPAGATTTTVYPCSEENAAAPAPQPVVVDQGKTTTVERGSAEMPWFSPQPTATADPIVMPNASSTPKGDVVKAEPKAEKTPAPPLPAAEVVKIEPRAEKPAMPPAPKEEAVDAEPEIRKAAAPASTKKGVIKAEAPPKAKPKAAGAKNLDEEIVSLEPVPEQAAEPASKSADAAKPKAVKATGKKKKVTKSKQRGKVKVAKRSKSKVARTKGRKTEVAQTEPKPEDVQTEPVSSDDKIITMTKKDMSIGNRIVNWLGL